jgi:hypothetical protein
MAISCQLESTNAIVIENGGAGRVLVNFTNDSLEFANIAEFQAFITENSQKEPSARAILLGNLLSKDPLLNSLTDWNGKKITIDPEQALIPNILKIV